VPFFTYSTPKSERLSASHKRQSLFMSRRLIWHRRDLRIRDNELYHCEGAAEISSLFVFDPSDYSPRPTGIISAGEQLRCVTHGPHLARRLRDAVLSLRQSLRDLGGELILRVGDPLEVIPRLVGELRVDDVAWSEIPGYYECIKSSRLRDVLLRDGPHRCSVYTTCSMTLVHPNDLPRDRRTWQDLARPKEKRNKKKSDAIVATPRELVDGYESSTNTTNIDGERFVGMPRIMGDFRRVARTYASVRELFGEPKSQLIGKAVFGVHVGAIPSLEELSRPLLETSIPLLGCLSDEQIRDLVEFAKKIPQQEDCCNLEEQSNIHLHNFVCNHAATANRSLCDVSNNQSSKLSVSLAMGLLSPRQVYHYVRQQQDKVEKAEDLNWIITHMEIRDFFIFDSFRNGSSAYAHKPQSPREWQPLSRNEDAFRLWASGKTNLPLVDAGMKELLTTGYISNRVRQNLASVLTKDLKLDWRLGAEFFQLCLEDHCPAANYGNWIYFAGVGGDPKNRHFRTVSQARRYDPDGRYVRKWIDRYSSRDVGEGDVEVMLRPWDFLKDWDAPIVPPETQLTWHDQERLKNTGRIRD
jgi:deoxyribodipyrimidine photo-lyase